MSLPRLAFLHPSVFSTTRSSQTFCSAACCRYAARQVGNYPRRVKRCSFSSISRYPGVIRPVMAPQRRCASTLQENTLRGNDAIIAGTSLPPASKVLPGAGGVASGGKSEEKQGPASSPQRGSATAEQSPAQPATDIGVNYKPEILKDTSALDVITTIKDPNGSNGKANSEGSMGGGAPGRPGGQSEATKPKLPAVGPAIGRLHHNFDSYFMVKQLVAGGFTYGQSVGAMKAVRGLLAVNLEKAKDSMVTKSMSENENYLFQAACSELKTETGAARRATHEKIRTDCAHVQHDYEQLEQRLREDLMNLKDEVTSLFNDRKITTREEQRAMEVKIQELNYKLTILLNGDMKREIEALRWTTTQRGLIAIAIIAVLVVTLIRYTSVQSHATKKETLHEVKEEDKTSAGLVASITSSTTPRRKPDPNDGDGLPFVSLG
ncbi:hypothetical protein DRE_06271 [Drechslerella stenobrocha 248]|uniref:Moz protein represents a chromatin-associated acetyltransferase n=1 Tax=Drechslerella stenobrocha 248 TaxID=1043628 RepID=W7HYB2_9PEZI|nr:hypothetical protein DRE_06271 [Drechslerella stenobrocha 248]